MVLLGHDGTELDERAHPFDARNNVLAGPVWGVASVVRIARPHHILVPVPIHVTGDVELKRNRVQIGLRQAAPRREGSCAGTFVWRRDGRPVSRAAARIRSSARDTNGFHWPFSSMFDAAELDDGLSPAAHPAHASLVAALGDDVLDGSLDLTCADLEAS